jgi:type I restriction enzyme M protein
MLDSETRRRIDTARDILVGKVPDPKSQVEQITIALVYKFMDDMDKQSIEMGGKASFFKGKFAKYGWSNIFDPRLGGIEMLALYGEAITNMSQNENLPQLFRDIFKNAFLPYRDPETLKLFLKTINEFTYDHSEKLGDAFEYLLSVLGSQGDAGQFRTPRHIIDFMVQVLGPKKNETVLDPACGTAGFLISAYKYILQNNQDPKGFKKPLGSLTAQEKQAIYKNFTGYDISPDMVRLSLVNLYLHGFVTPQIHEYDTLTSEERWNDYFDVILANPPFMSPKGGIKPHKRFSVASNRSEVLFVDYMAEHLTPNGRAAIIVPEGIIFQSAGAYKQLRKYLIEHNYLWAVVSLPAGVFNPYAGVKTSILFLDRSLARKTQEILFVKVEADGFDLGAQRRPIDRNDLPDALNTLLEYQKTLRVSSPSDSLTVEKTLRVSDKRASSVDEKPASFSPTPDSQTLRVSAPTQDSNRKETLRVLTVSKSRLAENDDYNLSADRYREVTRIGKQTYPLVKLGDVLETSSGGTPLRSKNEYYEGGTIPWVKSGEVAQGFVANTEEKITELGLKNSSAKIFPVNTVLVAMYGATAGQVGLLKIEATTNQAVCGIFPNDKIIPEFLYQILKSKTDHMISLGSGGAQPNISQAIIRNLEIPLPPLEIQRQIVDEIAAHQRIIDGARQVVEGWKPNIEIDGEWEQAKIGDVCDFIDYRGKTPNKSESGVRLITAKNVKMGMLTDEPKEYIADYDSWMTRGIPKKGDVLFTTEGPLGNVAIIDIDDEKFAVGQRIITLQAKDGVILPVFLANVLMSPQIQAEIEKYSTGSTVKGILARYFREIEIPLPPLSVQREIVARIERERAIIESNRELIRLYEEKVKKVIERVWEE